MLSERDLKVSRYTWVMDPPGGLARCDVLIQGDMVCPKSMWVERLRLWREVLVPSLGFWNHLPWFSWSLSPRIHPFHLH